MKDTFIPLRKWASGWLQVGLFRFGHLTYGMSRIPLLHCMCYAYFMFLHFIFVANLLYGIVLPLCFLHGIPLYPKVTDPWFAAFAFVFVFSTAQHLYEVVLSGGSMRTMWNEQRMWIAKSVTAMLFGCVDVFIKYTGLAKANFRLTNKAINQEKLKKYKKGEFDFQGAEMFGQAVLLLYALVLSFPILKGLIPKIRK